MLNVITNIIYINYRVALVISFHFRCISIPFENFRINVISI